jgi:hypothetical protein
LFVEFLTPAIAAPTFRRAAMAAFLVDALRQKVQRRRRRKIGAKFN